jgi:hypothetical protein
MTESLSTELSKLAINYDPPTLLIEYIHLRHHNTNNSIVSSPSYAHREIKFKTDFLKNTRTNPHDIANELIHLYPTLLCFGQNDDNNNNDEKGMKNIVVEVKLIQLLKKLISNCRQKEEVVNYEEDHNNISLNQKSLLVSSPQLDKNDVSNNCSRSENNSANNNKIEDDDKIMTMKTAIESMGDLNTVSQETLLIAKEEMNIVFDSNRILPGDEGYEYDKRVDYGDAMSQSSWDE